MSASVQWRDLSPEQRAERRREQAAAEAKAQWEFTDTKLTLAAAATLLKVTKPELSELLAEGRTTLRAEDLARYKNRRDCRPLPGREWPRSGSGRSRKAKPAEEEPEEDNEESTEEEVDE